MCTHLTKRSGSSNYYFRRKIPIDLLPHYGGKKEVVRSLGTPDKREAERRAREAGVQLDREFQEMREVAAAPVDQLQTAPGTAPAPFPTLRPDTDYVARRYLAHLRTARDAAAARGNDHLANFMHDRKWMLDDCEAALRGDIQLHGPIATIEAQRNALRAFLTGDGSVIEWNSHAAGAAGLLDKDRPAARKPDASPSLDELVDKWAGEKTPAAKTIQRARRVVAEFAGAAGVSRAGQVERSQVLKYKDAMLESGQSPANINNKLIMLSTVFNHAVKNDLGMASNPATGIKATDKRRAREKRLPFDLTALQAIFSSPVYIDHARPLGGGGEAAYWLPLIALFSGARIEEIAQLHPDDVYEESYNDATGKACSAWVIRFVDNDDAGQQVKTESSVRRIPVHPALLALGLTDEIKAAKEAKRSRVFHKLRPDSVGYESGNYSKWFGRWLRDVCKITDKRMVFHSFRHTFKHLARQAGIPKDAHSAITGHESGETGDDYGGLSYPLAPLVEAMQRYTVPGLALPAKPGK